MNGTPSETAAANEEPGVLHPHWRFGVVLPLEPLAVGLSPTVKRATSLGNTHTVSVVVGVIAHKAGGGTSCLPSVSHEPGAGRGHPLPCWRR